MAASQVAIVNRGLIKLGVREINSIDDAVKPARQAKSQWPMTRDWLLRKSRWKFSIKRVLLAENASPPSYGYKHQYTLPADYIRALEVSEFSPVQGQNLAVNSFDYELYRIESGNILINQTGPLKLRYISRVTDTTLWDVSFDDAMAARLAYDLSESLTQSKSKKEDAAKDFMFAMRDAAQLSAIEDPPEQIQDDSWWLSRYS